MEKKGPAASLVTDAFGVFGDCVRKRKVTSVRNLKWPGIRRKQGVVRACHKPEEPEKGSMSDCYHLTRGMGRQKKM